MQKKYLNLLLITIAFIIWMVIFYQMVLSDNEENDYSSLNTQNTMPSVEKKGLKNIEQYLSKRSVDPFITPFNYSAPKPKVSKPKPTPKPQNIPKLQILGILNDKDGPMAILGFPDNSILFVREKQKIEKFTITKISSDSVKYRYDGLFQTVGLKN